jgi:hypothetical protein
MQAPQRQYWQQSIIHANARQPYFVWESHPLNQPINTTGQTIENAFGCISSMGWASG